MAIKELFNDARPQVLFDPRASQRIDPRFKFTRNGPASYYDSQGILRYAPANQPRFDHDPTTGESLGLLVEEARTNLALRSQQLGFSAGNWFTNAATCTDNQGLAPDGTTTASRFVPNTTDTIHYVGDGTGASLSGTATISIFAKADGYNFFGLSFDYASSGGLFPGGAVFDLSTKQIALGASTTGSIQQLLNGWHRCTITATVGSTVQANPYIYASPSLVYSSFAGDGTSGILLWGFQFESGPYPTSYIPTTTSTVTRAADLLTIEAPLPSTGSIYIDARSLTSDVDNTLLSAAPASPSTDKLALAIRQPANLFNSKALVYEVDGAFKPTLPFPVPSNAQERNLITYGANNYHYRSDSARYTPSSSTSVPANMTRLGIGHDVTDPTKAMTGYINAVYLWPGEITPTVAEALVRGDVDPKDADAGTFTPEAGALAFAFNTQGTATDGDRVVQLPVRGSTNNILVDWGDNTSSSFIGAAASSTVSHTYSSAGIYPVQITADDDGTNSGLENLDHVFSTQPADLVRVLQWGGTSTFNPTTMYRTFYGCTQMDFETAARTNLPDTSACADWQQTFYNCSSITGTFPTFDTSAATNFNSTWYGCSSMVSFPFINTSSVTNMYYAWGSCSSLTSFPLIDTGSVTTLANAWLGCSSLTSFPAINTSSCPDFTNTWNSCSGLTSFPLIDTSNAGSLNATWYNCPNITSFPLIDTANCTSTINTWAYNSSLTSFPLLNLSNCTDMSQAWFGCSGLTSFPLIDTSSVTTVYATWYGCAGLTSFPSIDTSNVTYFSSTWFGCASLTSFPSIDTSSSTSFSYAWYGCNGLTSFPLINTSSATDLGYTWAYCSSLTSFPAINTSAVTGFTATWQNCTSLTSFPALNFSEALSFSSTWQSCGFTSFPAVTFPKATTFQYAWLNCTSLATFPAGVFDATGTLTALAFFHAFYICALTAASIENILVSLDTNGATGVTLSLDGGTNAAKTSWTTAANTAYTNLIGKGWTIYYNP